MPITMVDITQEGQPVVYETDRFLVLKADKSVKENGTQFGIYQIWNKEFNVLEMETTVLAQAYEVCVQWENVIRQAKTLMMQVTTGIALPGNTPTPPSRRPA